jgi:hypothetical protein
LENSEFQISSPAVTDPGKLGSLRRIGLAGPVFRFGQYPLLRLFLRRKISNVGFRAGARRDGNEPGPALVYFGTKRRRFSHARIPESAVFQPGTLLHLSRPTFGSGGIGMTYLHISLPSRKVPIDRTGRVIFGNEALDCERVQLNLRARTTWADDLRSAGDLRGEGEGAAALLRPVQTAMDGT